MKCFVGVTLGGLVIGFVLGKVFGIIQTSTMFDFLVAVALMLSWFTFVIVNVQKTPGEKALPDEFGHQEDQYELM